MKKILLLLAILLIAESAFGKTIVGTFIYGDDSVDGFKLYDNGIYLCSSTAPAKRTITCEAELGFGAHSFTLTAYSGDQESLPSNAYPLVITITSPSLGTVIVED